LSSAAAGGRVSCLRRFLYRIERKIFLVVLIEPEHVQGSQQLLQS